MAIRPHFESDNSEVWQVGGNLGPCQIV